MSTDQGGWAAYLEAGGGMHITWRPEITQFRVGFLFAAHIVSHSHVLLLGE